MGMLPGLSINSTLTIKQTIDVCAVSLRDLRRFQAIYTFFDRKYYIDSRTCWEDTGCHGRPRIQKSVVMSLLICYLMRFSLTSQRRDVFLIIERQLGISVDLLEKIFSTEMGILVEHFQLESGIIKNKALQENLLCMFVCLLTKVPLLIIGKPGSSKSLSLRPHFQSTKGRKVNLHFLQSI